MKREYGKERIYNKDFEDRDDVVRWDVQGIKPEQTLKLTFISKNSPHRQGVCIQIDVGKGYIEVLGVKEIGFLFWWDTAPRESLFRCVSPKGLVSIFNIFDDRGYVESQMYKSGMILEEEGSRITYHCNDYGDTDKFDKLVFSIEKL